MPKAFRERMFFPPEPVPDLATLLNTPTTAPTPSAPSGPAPATLSSETKKDAEVAPAKPADDEVAIKARIEENRRKALLRRQLRQSFGTAAPAPASPLGKGKGKDNSSQQEDAKPQENEEVSEKDAAGESKRESDKSTEKDDAKHAEGDASEARGVPDDDDLPMDDLFAELKSARESLL